MRGSGGISREPHRRLGWLLSLLAAWIGVAIALGAWWGRLASRQAERIAELEAAAGLTVSEAHDQWERTQRMLLWEGSVFLVLLVLSTVALAWLHWQDRKRTRALQAFFASVTHELRTPLTSIRLQAESIADRVGADPGAAPLVARLLQDTERLESQVERTLELARVEGGGPLAMGPLDLRRWLERAAAGWRELFGERLLLQVEIPAGTSVEADAAALTVIFRNLIENSVRHSRLERVRVQVRAESGSGSVAIEVRDDGQGFHGDPARLGALFEKGAHSSGAGVGLYLARLLARRMRGELRLRGGQGFPVTLRLREAPAA